MATVKTREALSGSATKDGADLTDNLVDVLKHLRVSATAGNKQRQYLVAAALAAPKSGARALVSEYAKIENAPEVSKSVFETAVLTAKYLTAVHLTAHSGIYTDLFSVFQYTAKAWKEIRDRHLTALGATPEADVIPDVCKTIRAEVSALRKAKSAPAKSETGDDVEGDADTAGRPNGSDDDAATPAADILAQLAKIRATLDASTLTFDEANAVQAALASLATKAAGVARQAKNRAAV